MSEKTPEPVTLNDEFDVVEQDAVRWFGRRQNDPTHKEDLEFEMWLAACPTHIQKYTAVCSLYKRTQEFTDNPEMAALVAPMLSDGCIAGTLGARFNAGWLQGWHGGIAAFIQGFFSGEVWRGAQSSSNTHQHTTQDGMLVATWRARWALKGLAAASAILLVVFFTVPTTQITSTPVHYSTGVGEIKTVRLADGSQVKLNTRTALTVDFTSTQRKIILDMGQASFSVAKNPNRPFVVVSRLGQVTALGTEFDVYKMAKKMTVSLIEGKIEVQASTTKLAGKLIQSPENSRAAVIIEVVGNKVSSISITEQGVSPIEENDATSVTAWQREKIVFTNKSLADVLEELNRYSKHPISLRDVDRREEKITVVLPTDIPAALVMLKKHFNLSQISGKLGKIILISNNQIYT